MCCQDESVIVREQLADDYEAIRHVSAESFRRPHFRPPTRTPAQRSAVSDRTAAELPDAEVRELLEHQLVVSSGQGPGVGLGRRRGFGLARYRIRVAIPG
jgi:hypothetical protein